MTNSQSTATSSNFQQSVTVTPSACSGCYPYINANWSNVEFSTGVGSSGPSGPLDAWIESGASNTAASTLIWVNLTSSTIAGSGGTLTIYMSFMPTTSPVTSGYTGYAPQFFCASGCAQTSYGQYDNGESVFTYYQPFGGLSTLPTGWAFSGTASNVVFATNDLTIIGTGTTRVNLYSNVVSTEQTVNFPVDIDTLANFTLPVSQIFGTGFVLEGPTLATSGCPVNTYAGTYIRSSSVVTVCSDAKIRSGNVVSLVTQVWTTYIPNTASLTSYASYTNPKTEAISAPTANDVYQVFTTQNSIIPSLIYWTRTRTPPPNNIQPAVSFGSFV